MHHLTLLAALVSVSSAQSTVSLFLPIFDAQSLVASIIASDATATTYALGCSPGTDPTDCGIPNGFEMTEGPKTVHFTVSASEAFDDVSCSLDGTTSALCTITAVSGTYTTTSVTDIPGLADSSFFIAATITDNLTGGAAATTGATPTFSGAEETTTSVAATAAETSALQTGFVSKTSSPITTSIKSSVAAPKTSSSSSAASAKSSTAGMPQITANAGWAVGGMAVALAVAGF